MIKTEINVYEGFDPVCPVPKVVTAASLAHRLALVQETYRPDSVDAFFDCALWMSILEFAANFQSGTQVGIVDRCRQVVWLAKEPEERDEIALATYLSKQKDDVDRGPAEYVMVRQNNRVLLCIVTEFWTNVGGPTPYADSYTYSIYSNDDVSERVMQHMSAAKDAAGWQVSNEVRQAPKIGRRY